MKIQRLFAYFVFGIGCLTAKGQAAPSTFCLSTTGIDQLKAYITCQESSRLDACVGLATALGQRPPSEADQKRYLELIEHNQAPILTSLARKLHQLWREKRKITDPMARLIELNRDIQKKKGAFYPEDDAELRKTQAQAAALALAIARRNSQLRYQDPIYEPALRFANGGIHDIANSDYDHLPEDYKQKNHLYAQEILRKYTQKNIGSDEKNLGYLVFDQTTSPVKEALLESFKSNGVQAVHEAVANHAETFVAEHMVEDLVNRHIGQRLGEGMVGVWKALPLMSKIPPWLRARLFSVGLIFLNEFFYPRLTSCTAEAHPAAHIEVNRWTEGCHEVYQVNQNVIAFLQKSKDEQMTELKDTRACSFYEKFHEAVLGQPKFTSLTCHGDRSFELVTENKDGDIIEHKVLYWPGTKEIREIAIRPRHLNPNVKYVRPKAASLVQLTSSGEILYLATSEHVQAAVMPLRLYIMDAHACCNAEDPNYKALCMNAYNPAQPVSSELDPKKNKRAGITSP